MIKGYLKIIVLKAISDKEHSGYSLIKEIYKVTGTLKPSYGSIYPLLKQLYNNGLVKIRKSKRKKLYSLTEKGTLDLKQFRLHHQEMINTFVESWKVFEMILDKDDKEFISDFSKCMENGLDAHSQILPELLRLKCNLFKIKKKNLLEKQQKKIKASLFKCNKEMEKLLMG